MGTPPGQVTPSAPTASNPAPWYAHLVTGGVVMAAGVALSIVGNDMILGAALVTAGATFLGVSAGVSAAGQ